MKKILILTFFLVSFFSFDGLSQNSQPNVITMNTTIWNKLKVKYEHGFSDHWSYGTYGELRYGMIHKGWKISPFIRWYPGGHDAPEGFFLFNKYLFAKVSSVLDSEDLWGEPDTFLGGGFGLGWQVYLGNNDNFVLDIATGFRAGLPITDNNSQAYDDGIIDSEEASFLLDMLTGPTSIFDFAIGLGWNF